VGCTRGRSVFRQAMIEIPISMTGNIGKTEFANMFAHAAACIRSEHQRLTELDSIGGDGDHGTTMLRAAEQMEDWTDTSTQSLTDSLKAAGWRVLGVDGGASSSLLGTFFAGMGDVVLAGDAMNCNEFAQSLQAGLRAVSRQTKARPGDKTMMDALIPAVDAVSAAAGVDKSIPNALDDAALAAKLGADSTRDLVARFGRARSLGERTRGHADAGATSIALIFRGFREGLEKGSDSNG
jgi:phosphoenolpyruvate---glycerone phosphotransferase subunit DhaL